MRADTPRYARYKQLHPDTSRYARYKQICPDTSSYTNHVQICPDMSRYKTAEEGQDRTMLTRRVNWRKKLAPIRKNQEKQEDNKVMTFTVVQAPSRWDDSKPTLKTFKQHRAPAGDLNPFFQGGKKGSARACSNEFQRRGTRSFKRREVNGSPKWVLSHSPIRTLIRKDHPPMPTQNMEMRPARSTGHQNGFCLILLLER
jgi:hypothetical protein